MIRSIKARILCGQGENFVSTLLKDLETKGEFTHETFRSVEYLDRMLEIREGDRLVTAHLHIEVYRSRYDHEEMWSQSGDLTCRIVVLHLEHSLEPIAAAISALLEVGVQKATVFVAPGLIQSFRDYWGSPDMDIALETLKTYLQTVEGLVERHVPALSELFTDLAEDCSSRFKDTVIAQHVISWVREAAIEVFPI